jgi:DNA adenine methylase
MGAPALRAGAPSQRWPAPKKKVYNGKWYYIGKDSTLFKSLYLQRNFPIHHNGFKHELLRDLLYSHQSGFILSYNDSPTIREWYKEFEIIELPVHYTMGQGENGIGRSRSKKQVNHVKKTLELLIVKKAKFSTVKG